MWVAGPGMCSCWLQVSDDKSVMYLRRKTPAGCVYYNNPVPGAMFMELRDFAPAVICQTPRGLSQTMV